MDLTSLKVGDKFVVKSEWQGYRFAKVERLTKTLIIASMKGNSQVWKFRRETGDPVPLGEFHNRPQAILLTDKVQQKIDRIRLSNQCIAAGCSLNRLSFKDIEKLPETEVKKIIALINQIKECLS